MSSFGGFVGPDQVLAESVARRMCSAQQNKETAPASVQRLGPLGPVVFGGLCSTAIGPGLTIHALANARIDAREELTSVPHLTCAATAEECIARAYGTWGEDCVHHLKGDFSFVIWDERSRVLFGARDRFGIKPMFWTQVRDGVAFSSSLKSVVAVSERGCEADERAIAEFLLYGMIADPVRTPFSGVFRVPPAHSIRVHNGEVRIGRYWTVPLVPERRMSRMDAQEGFREVFDRAVTDRLPNSGAVVFLSGGLDSGAVAASAVKAAVGHGTQVSGVTAVYEQLIPDRERYYAGQTAAALGINTLYMPQDAYRLCERMTEPGISGVALLYQAFRASFIDQVRAAATQAEVALTGHAGDEVFKPAAPTTSSALIRSLPGIVQTMALTRRVPRVGIRTWLRSKVSNRSRQQAIHAPLCLNRTFARRIGADQFPTDPFRSSCPAGYHRPDAYRLLSSPFWSFAFEQYDPENTACPIEFRHPFLDVRVIDFCLGLPSFPQCFGKTLLRGAFPELPPAVRHRPKTPLKADPAEMTDAEHRRELANLIRSDQRITEYIDVGRTLWCLTHPGQISEAMGAVSLAIWLNFIRTSSTSVS